ncbi:hypothetical protein C900_04254 [Fulvivirga imtechensis AK7]|uniref:Uncharacterized protein n=1 Tax=Fulvivirga imtechensis AK7 TaxID=1237149 RepID=L8K1S0_9BACT|nr:hypothetical protein [Fulvivirga imtechensis]ELR73402.1 hypothetical protein C900_04254 [Fulvivirga imtechensis AK7]
MFRFPFDPTDIQQLIDLLRETMEAHRDPAVRAKLAGFIKILEGWLRRRPTWRQAWRVLGDILKWARGGRPVSGVIETASKMILQMWDKMFFRLPWGGSAAGVGAAATIMVLALALLGYSIYKTATAPSLEHRGGPSCMIQPVATDLGPVSDWGIIANEKELFDNVMKKAQGQCDQYSAQCAGDCDPPLECKPNVSLQDFDISNYLVYRKVTFEKFNCTCECLE